METEITCDVATLHQSRPFELAGKLSGVSPVRPHVEPKSRPYDFVLVARYGEQITTVERDWRFPSLVNSIQCRYMERWLPIDGQYSLLRLRHAYFHLDHHSGPDNPPEEIFAFHWEPLADVVEDGDGGYLGKPHLHITCAREPVGHAHFGTTLTVDADRQSDTDYLNELLEEVFKMVQIEVLERINRDNTGLW